MNQFYRHYRIMDHGHVYSGGGVTLLCREAPNGQIEVALAICSQEDNYDKKRGRASARWRMGVGMSLVIDRSLFEKDREASLLSCARRVWRSIRSNRKIEIRCSGGKRNANGLGMHIPGRRDEPELFIPKQPLVTPEEVVELITSADITKVFARTDEPEASTPREPAASPITVHDVDMKAAVGRRYVTP